MLSRLIIALALAAAVISGGALAFLRTDFVANNLCSYAVATIEEATQAQVKVARCSVEPAVGKLTIDGLQVGVPGGRIDLKVARVFVQVVVRPLLQRVRLERLEVDRPELHLSLDQQGGPTPKGGQCLPEVLERFELGRVKVRKASVEVTSAALHVDVPHAAISIKGRGGQLHVEVATRGGSVELPGRTIGLISTRTSAGVDLRGVGQISLERADLIGSEASLFVKGKLGDLCAPSIEALANVRVDDLETAAARLLPGVLHGVKGALSADVALTLTGKKPRAKGEVRLQGVSIEGFNPGDARVRFDADRARVKAERLEVPIAPGVVTGTAELRIDDASLPLSADLNLRDVELAEVLRKLGAPHSPVVLKASGRAQVKGPLSPLALSAETVLEVADFAVLDRAYEKRASAKRMFEFARGKVTSALSIDGDKVVFRGASVEVGASHVDVAEATFFGDQRKGMQLAAHGENLDLDDFGGHLGPLPTHGRATVAGRVGGPYRDLRVDSSASVKDFHFLDLSLGDISTQLGFSLASMQLSLEQIEGHKDRSDYQGRIVLGLGEQDTPIDAHLEMTDAYVHDLIDLAVGVVPSLASLNDAKDVDGEVAGVIDVKGPLAGPEGSATLEFGELSLWGEKFDSGDARFALHGGQPRLQIEQLELRRGAAARFTAGGRFGPDWQLEIDARSEHFTLADVDPLARAKMSGPLAVSARVRGVSSHPLIDAALKFSEGSAAKAQLGDGDLSLKIDGKAMSWQGTVGKHSMRGEATLEGDFPYSCTAKVRVPDLLQYGEAFAPEWGVQSGSFAADAEIKGSLLAWRNSSGTISLSQLKVVRDDLPFENDGPAQLSFGPAGVRIERLALRAPYTSAQLSGSRGRDGKLELRVVASIDGRLLQGLVPDIEHAGGTWQLQASLGGTVQAPTVLGNFRVEDGSVSLRGLPLAARSLNGSISFSQDALVIDSLAGKLNNGEAQLSGGMEMKQLHPERIDMSAHISDVNVKLQENLGATLDGDLTLFGPPLEPVLGGSVIVSRMKYAEDIEIERSLLDFSRRPPTPKVLTKSAVLVHFDLDVHLSRGVRVENNLARTDLKGDLKVTGTSRAVGLLGSINTVHGTATFRGNEFQIEQGVLTFSDRQRIRASFDFSALAQVKEYKVRLHAFGTPGEPHVALSSDPALAEADLGFLLTFGFVSQNLQQASFSAGSSGLAIGVEALNKVTGFSEEVRRFIPKNPILRDPNIDFASDFSVATNRLEPMARFRSHLINDRLDLRVLEGLTSGRYRGVISYQLTDALSTRVQLDNEHLTQGTDFGADLHLRWEGE